MQGGVGPTIHFHGMKMDKGYFWYDGVAGLTQCNIGYVTGIIPYVHTPMQRLLGQPVIWTIFDHWLLGHFLKNSCPKRVLITAA